jgi:hypothetical protein
MNDKEIYNDIFETTSGKQIAETVTENSFFAMEKAIDINVINKILSEVDLFNLKLNSNEITSVHADSGYFSSNAMAKSNALYELLTSNKIFDISREYLGDKFRLKCHRVYSTDSFIRGIWHTDNKNHGQVNKTVKGLVFIICLNDTKDGEFQAIRKSHLSSRDFHASNFDEDFIKNYNKEDIVSFKYPAGSIIVFDSRTIHRAKPYYRFLWSRKSLFFQIDNEIDDGEKIIINSSFVKNLNKELCNYLGIGKKNTMPHEPYGNSIKNLSFQNILQIQFQLFLAITNRIFFLSKALFTGTSKRKIKNLLGIKRKNYNTDFKKK